MAAKQHNARIKLALFLSKAPLYVGGGLIALMLVCAAWSVLSPIPPHNLSISSSYKQLPHVSDASDTSSSRCNTDSTPNLIYDPPDPNFYDDPQLTYTIDSPAVTDWDRKRSHWLNQHQSFASTGSDNRILMVTGSQAEPCKNPNGDYLLMKLFKNKVDYCRRHGIDIFYNNVLFQPQMYSFWAKTATVKAAMLAHPEAEWIWWIDSDAVITDMDFKLPIERYKDHNMVIHGWMNLILEKRSWTSINAGVFLIRNCQWAMDLMDMWARMGPQSPAYEKWGEILRGTFKDKIFPQSDDQSGLAYLILTGKENKKIYLENEYYFEGYWVEIVGTFDNITQGCMEAEKEVVELRRRHAEKLSESYGRVWEAYSKDGGPRSCRRPFITHFTGCQPCSGAHNPMYSGTMCLDGMEKALVFADNQVLRNYGFVHPDVEDPFTVIPLPFNYPAY